MLAKLLSASILCSINGLLYIYLFFYNLLMNNDS